jgi:hypothetical protein
VRKLACLTASILFFLSASLLAATDTVVLSIVGAVQFSVPADWKVVDSNSDPALTLFEFQIDNPADEGTRDSTNLVLISYSLTDDSSKKAYSKKESARGPEAKDASVAEGWNCSTFDAMQGETNYTIWDCHRTVSKTGVYVRFAWPHLPRNPRDFDKTMQTDLSDLLQSVVPSPK